VFASNDMLLGSRGAYASVLVGIVKSLNKSGELRRRLGDPTVGLPKTPAKSHMRVAKACLSSL
jgi:hypothetical protein